VTSTRIPFPFQSGREPCGSRPGLKTALFVSWAGVFLILALTSLSRAELLDPFEETLGWTDTSGGGSSLVLDTVPGKTGNALQLDYDFSGTSYIQIQKDFNLVNLRTQGANAVRFQYKAVGVANTFEIKLTDNDSPNTGLCDRLDYRFTIVPDGQWRTVTVPFVEFFPFMDGDGVFQADETSHLGFGVVQKDLQLGEGTLWIDNVQLVHLSSYAYTLNSYETPNFNDRKKPGELGGPDFPELGGTGGVATYLYRTDFLVSGAQSLEFNYTVGTTGGPYTAFVSQFSALPLLVPSSNARLSFFMRRMLGSATPRVELWWTGGFNSVALSAYGDTGAIPSDFVRYQIPLSDFAGIDVNSLTQVKIVFNTVGAVGQILLDDMTIEEIGGTEATVRDLDYFTVSASDSFWELYKHELSESTLDLPFDLVKTPIEGGNRVFRLDYEFPTASEILWVHAERSLRPNPLVERVFTMDYMGDGDDKNLEFKVEDDNGVVYSRTVRHTTDTDGIWKSVRIPLEDLSPFSGGERLDLRRVRRLSVAISGTGGGSGTLVLDNLYTGVANGLLTTAGRGGVIRSLSVPDNPFSPNGDGSKDSAQFIADLGESADVSLGVYNLRGGKVRQLDGTRFEAGPATLVWDGRGDDGRLVANGLYFFRFRAVAVGGAEDEIKQLIGVVR
jgi:hypothetical protein